MTDPLNTPNKLAIFLARMGYDRPHIEEQVAKEFPDAPAAEAVAAALMSARKSW